MSVEFENAILAGVTLIREAIQSQNYSAGTSGWTINQNGTAEFADLTIRSSDGTDSTITIANGVISIRDGSNTLVVEISAGGYKLYTSTGILVAEITPFGGATNDPGFIAYNPSGTRYYAMLSRGFIEFGKEGEQYDVQPGIAHATSAGSDPSILSAGSGYVGNGGAISEAQWRLVSPTTGADRPRMEVDTDDPTGACDLEVSGNIRAANIKTGSFQVTPTIANEWTANVAVTFPEPFVGSVPVVMVTPSGGGPGSGTTTELEWQTTGVTVNGFNCRIRRGNTGTLTLSYLAVSKP